MREIKFRQAIFKDGKFHHWHYWGFVGYQDSFVAPIEIHQQSWTKTYEVKESQQYIGLECSPVSLGPRLYEGDIIKDFKGRILQIAYADRYARYMTSYDGRTCQYYLNDGISGDWKNRNTEFMELIGSNHETPELLKETNGS